MEPNSIDSVVDAGATLDMRVSGATPPGTEASAGRPLVKTRFPHLRGLQRGGSRSTWSLSGQPRARSNSQPLRGGGKASISCVSLASGASYAQSYSSELSAGYSTAPTSVATTPAATAVFGDKLRPRTATVQTPTTSSLPLDIRPSSKAGLAADYFSRPTTRVVVKRPLDLWTHMPPEIRMCILRYLTPLEIIRCSTVCKSWHDMCFDGQLWAVLDTTDYYRQIPAAALTKIIISAGPFVRDLNLRGCVQLRDRWRRNSLVSACKNLEYFSLEGCRIGETPIHFFLAQNANLVHVNLAGLAGATNTTLKLLARNCPRLEELNISWCHNVDTRGLKRVVEGCPRLRDLRAGEVRGFDDVQFMDQLFRRNTLERLLLMNCHSLNDESLKVLMQGIDPEIDILTDRPVVPPRRLKHLELTHCRGITDAGVESMVGQVPFLEGLQLAKCHHLTDRSVSALLPTCPVLTHVDLEEDELLTNATLAALANAPCAPHLRHLCVSYCELISDQGGMLAVLKTCRNLSSLHVDNTAVTDLLLAEAVSLVRSRNRAAMTSGRFGTPYIGLRIEAYDCPRVTWTGVREVLASNAENLPMVNWRGPQPTKEIIGLKCFYSWQPTVEEHMKRVLRGDLPSAARLERKWADWMMMNEESSMPGAGSRRRRRRARDAQALHADEQGGVAAAGGRPRPQRRRTLGSCVVM